MKRLAGLYIFAALLALPEIAMAAPGASLDALHRLAVHGLVPGYDGSTTPAGTESVLLAARAIARVEAGGASAADVADAQRLLDSMPAQLDALGVRVTNVRQEIRSMETHALGDAAFASADVALQTDGGNAAAHLRDVPSGPLRAEISGIAFEVMPVYMHALAPHPVAIAGRPLAVLNSNHVLANGLIRFGNAPFASAGHSPVTLAFFGMVQAPASLQAPVVSPSASSTGLPAGHFAAFGSPNTPEPLETPFVQNASVAGISFRVHAIEPLAAAHSNVTLNGAQPSPGAFELKSFAASSPQLSISPAFRSLLAAPLPAASAQPGDFALAQPSGYGSAFYGALVPNSGGLEVRVSAPVRLGGVAFRGNLNAAHLQEVSPNAFGTMPSLPATTDRVSAGTTFDVRAFSRSVSLELGSSYEKLSRDDRSALTYSQYTPPVINAPVSSFVPPDIGAPDYVNPNYLSVTHRTINASAAVPITHSLSLNLRYDTQFYTGSYSTLVQNVDERKDSYLGNLTYQIPRTSSAIVFSAKQYRYRDAFVPAFNVTQNRADLNFTVKF